MAQIKIAIKDNRAALLGSVDLVAGTTGQVCKLYFDEEWRSLKKYITYKLGSTIVASEEIKGDEAIIPPNVLVTAGIPLEVGFTGFTTNNSMIKPTSWCLLGHIQNGASIYFGNVDKDDGDGKHIVYDGGVIG